MNYRHAYHAGNFADVFKHVLLTRVLAHLALKEAPFRVIDTHAGAGRYDLAADAAERTGEWREGIGRVLAAPPSGEAAELLRPYLDCVRAVRGDQIPGIYPGSPLLALALARRQDRLAVCELHAEDRQSLIRSVGRDRRASVADIDGWTALKAWLPPPERRGLVMVDPPFEEPGEFHRMQDGLVQAHRRWATGIYLLWYPIKNRDEVEAFVRRVARTGIPKILRVELTVTADAGKLTACGILTVNPPWTLERELSAVMPYLARTLGGDAGKHRCGWVAA